MKLMRERPPNPADAPATAGAEVRTTLLMPSLFERLEEGESLSVLDVGYGVSDTLTFFSQYRSRVHFAGLYDARDLQVLPADDVEAHLEQACERLFSFPAGTTFDICLLWDFLNYLPVPALRAFSNALWPYLHERTVGHGFGAFKAGAPGASPSGREAGMQYGVRDAGHLVVRPRQGGSPPTHPHSRTVLTSTFRCFDVTRGTLLREGNMELLLQARKRPA